jgi:hypothetical protein
MWSRLYEAQDLGIPVSRALMLARQSNTMIARQAGMTLSTIAWSGKGTGQNVDCLLFIQPAVRVALLQWCESAYHIAVSPHRSVSRWGRDLLQWANGSSGPLTSVPWTQNGTVVAVSCYYA